MKGLDRWLQRRRMSQAAPFVPEHCRLLDVGCHKGELFEFLGERVRQGLGLDPHLAAEADLGRVRLLPGRFPEDLGGVEPFDAITMLAVLEHVPEMDLPRWAQAARRWLRPEGRLILTVPAAQVDRILRGLHCLRLIAGMDLEHHHRFDPRRVPGLFDRAGFHLFLWKRFQFGLNNLFVFRAPAT